jgi:hypothetical protein
MGYSVDRHQHGWLVAVDGAGVLVCESKRVAHAAVRQAEEGAGPAAAIGQVLGARKAAAPADGAPASNRDVIAAVVRRLSAQP